MDYILLSFAMLIKVTLAADQTQSIVAILRKEVFACEGGIISQWKVLTSCRCLTNWSADASILTVTPASEIKVVAEIKDLDQLGRYGFVTQAAKVTPHALCKLSDILIEHDIGLITVRLRFPLRDTIQPLRPPEYNRYYTLKYFMSYLGTKKLTCTFSGFGLTSWSPKLLTTVEIFLLPFEDCITALCDVGIVSVCPLDVYSAKRQCAQVKNSNTTLCLKTSGSPIMCYGGVVGVLSQGLDPWLPKTRATNCSTNRGDVPIVVARIDSYEFEQLFPVEEQESELAKSCGMTIGMSSCLSNVFFSVFFLLF